LATKPTLPKDKLLPRLTLKFFSMPRLTAILWIAVTAFGALSYGTLLRREGFPSINIPVAIVTGTYLVNDPAKVDDIVAKPLSELALKQPGANMVQTQSSDNFFTLSVQYKEGTDATKAAHDLETQAKQQNVLPEGVVVRYSVPYFGATGGDIQKIDEALSLYKKDGHASTTELSAKAAEFAKALEAKHLSTVKSVAYKDQLITTAPLGQGASASVQRSFDRFAIRQDGTTISKPSILITVADVPGSDVIKLDDQVRAATAEILKTENFKNYDATVSASFAPNIKDNISELQRVLLEGLLAILLVGSIIIAVRASIITVISMVTVILGTLGVLFLLGYTLNVITLFALILGLSLIVDDTIIMVEALDAARKRTKTPREAVHQATRKVSRAMVAATTTAALCFAPLAFVGGILGSFIRAIPVTIISSLLISLSVALIFIPFFARFLLLRTNKMGSKGVREVAASVEARIARGIVRPMLWARNSRKRLMAVGFTALLVALLFIGAGVKLGSKVQFNIFPQSKDTNQLLISMNYPAGTTVAQAEQISSKVESRLFKILGNDFIKGSYFGSGSAQSASFMVDITSYSKRDTTSVQFVDKINHDFATFKDAKVAAGQVDLGPPAAAFNIQLDATNRSGAYKLAHDLEAYLKNTELVRVSGEKARFTNINVSSQDEYDRADGKSVVLVSSGFNGTDTTTLVTLAKSAITKEFTPQKLASYGLAKDAIRFDLGQEQENQDSFKTLAFAFPLLLLVIYLLLSLEFRSLLQPLLIFMAIPFSIFGVMLGLFLTHNPISFFAALGFFALIGLSIKNTILLTDFANQSRAAGSSAVDSAAAAVSERFRPLVATSITAIVSLIPLAITSPFWQGLAVVLMFGLASSTILVLLVFPYFYLGAEYLRFRISKKLFGVWLLSTIALAYIASLVHATLIAPVVLLSLLTLIVAALLNKTQRLL
jgi:multidrug efflux pump subunit AcrB